MRLEQLTSCALRWLGAYRRNKDDGAWKKRRLEEQFLGLRSDAAGLKKSLISLLETKIEDYLLYLETVRATKGRELEELCEKNESWGRKLDSQVLVTFGLFSRENLDPELVLRMLRLQAEQQSQQLQQ